MGQNLLPFPRHPEPRECGLGSFLVTNSRQFFELGISELTSFSFVIISVGGHSWSFDRWLFSSPVLKKPPSPKPVQDSESSQSSNAGWPCGHEVRFLLWPDSVAAPLCPPQASEQGLRGERGSGKCPPKSDFSGKWLSIQSVCRALQTG